MALNNEKPSPHEKDVERWKPIQIFPSIPTKNYDTTLRETKRKVYDKI